MKHHLQSIQLSRDTMKYIATLTMLLNHIAVIFMKQNHWLTQFFINIGYFTAITMCYFLVEGYHHTHSKKQYAWRLFIFAILSQIPFSLAFTQNGLLEFQSFNMLFSLLICFFILITLDQPYPIILKVIIITLLIALSLICDWPLFAPIFTLLFAWSYHHKMKTKIAFFIAMLLFGFYNFMGYAYLPLKQSIIYTLWSLIGMLFASILIIYFYNSQHIQKGKTFAKWFFYIFYPAHLFLLGVIRIMML